jgi:acetoin utilization deacetylase AcuC-like enzyme
VRYYFPDTPELPLPPGHRFPAAKYPLLVEMVRARKILARGSILPAPLIARSQLEMVHDAHYVGQVMAGTLPETAQRRIGVPWSEILRDRSLATVGGTLAAGRAALEEGISGQMAGGTHHAHAGFGSGYCVFNDCAVAISQLRFARRIDRAAILDLDVHQGDGNAALLAGDARSFVASVHGAKNFPFRKVASDLDIELPDGTGDVAFLDACARALTAVMSFRPDIVFYNAGVDPLIHDRLGRMSVSAAALERRDRLVIDALVDAGIPVAVVSGGGYTEPIAHTVEAYAATVEVAAQAHARRNARHT